MKALSIRQPWAWLIVNGHKDIENRGWKTNVRGRILIHASATMQGASRFLRGAIVSCKIKHPRSIALVVAAEITKWMRELCEPERFIFAGSLRRGKAEVGDIEVVYVPRVIELPDPGDLLGNLVATNLVDRALEAWLKSGHLAKRVGAKGGSAWGASNKLAVHTASGIGIDFFAGDKRNFWTLLVCRTGSAESNMRICAAAESRGLKWNPYRGFEDRRTGELLFVPESEEAVFKHVGLPYLEPKLRV